MARLPITKRQYLGMEVVRDGVTNLAVKCALMHKLCLAPSIHNVVQTEWGRVGSLNCWEHIQVIRRY